MEVFRRSDAAILLADELSAWIAVQQDTEAVQTLGLGLSPRILKLKRKNYWAAESVRMIS